MWQIPTIRDDDRLLGGISRAIADEIGVDVVWIRVAWILLFSTGGWGVVLYAVCWGGLSWWEYRAGAAAHDIVRVPKGRSSRSRSLGLGLFVLGLAGLFSEIPGLHPDVQWSAGLMALGLLISWRRFGPEAVNRSRGRYPMAQAVAGLVITTLGAALLVFVAVGVNTAAAILYLIIFLVAAVVLATSPWWWRFVQKLDRERQAKAASDERAVVAAHLHDSVLQTLSLIQRNSDNPQVMLNLARRQERELRNWLDPDRASRLGGSVRGHLDTMVTEIEELYGIPVEAVVVGDCLVDERIEQTLAAAREAVVNSAKHAGFQGEQSDQIDLYVEINSEHLELFVRDRGVGFDRAAVGEDRRGIQNSIEDRMQRVGGSSAIHSALGEGTEVELKLPFGADHQTVLSGSTLVPPTKSVPPSSAVPPTESARHSSEQSTMNRQQ